MIPIITPLLLTLFLRPVVAFSGLAAFDDQALARTFPRGSFIRVNTPGPFFQTGPGQSKKALAVTANGLQEKVACPFLRTPKTPDRVAGDYFIPKIKLLTC